jgi:hypothetical protein
MNEILEDILNAVIMVLFIGAAIYVLYEIADALSILI